MSREARHDILFEPVTIGPRTLRNRFYQVPHCTGFGVEKPWTQAAFRGMKAEGGWAAVCTEYCSISPDSDETPYVSARLWDDEDMRALSLMTAKAHEHGALAGVELWHGGVYAESREARLPQLAPSQIGSDLESVVVPKRMDRDDIRGADHMVDLWDVVIGSMWGAGRLDSGPSRFYDQGYQMQWSGRAREATAKPIVVVGRFTDPDRMAELVRGGTIDLIGAARPSISDPFLPEKIEQGRYDEIRECIGCNACYSRSIWGRHLGCTQNATAGEEYRRGWHPERFDRAANADRAVLVVGAGPAGMECATVLGKRGMELVHLVDGADDIGGCMSWITRMPGLRTWG